MGIDDHGLEGLELAGDDWLAGADGAALVEQDPAGHVLAEKNIKKSHLVSDCS